MMRPLPLLLLHAPQSFDILSTKCQLHATQEPDVLLLDEPTNHLDWEAIDWLASYLSDPRRAKNTALLLVTHDRYFLERTCDEILELDGATVRGCA